MEERPKIKFNVSVFSVLGVLVDKFTVEAETRRDAEIEIKKQIRSMGNVNYKIT